MMRSNGGGSVTIAVYGAPVTACYNSLHRRQKIERTHVGPQPFQLLPARRYERANMRRRSTAMSSADLSLFIHE
jgi:hypothetical protein